MRLDDRCCGFPAVPRRHFCAIGATAAIGVGAAPSTPAMGRPVEVAMVLADPTAGPPIVALTLDACPGGFDARIAGVLADLRVPATVFVSAPWLAFNRDGLAFLHECADLLAIENHGERHIAAVLGSGTIYDIPIAGTLDRVREEVEGGARAIHAASGVACRWFRGATGLYSPEAIDAIEELGYRVAGYSLAADLGASLPAARVAARVEAAHSGDIIVAHVNQPKRPSGEGLADGIARLAASGVRFVHLDDLPVTASQVR
jgi:peptidoglycan/xylan/chitin deacetylase (PgdA/CDA1 family)